MRRSSARILRVVAAAYLLVTAGCDRTASAVGQITGTVRYQGREIKSDDEVTWNVVFVTADAAATRYPTTIGRSGTYVLNGVPLGQVKIAIVGTPRIPEGLRPKNKANPKSEHEKLRKHLTERYSDPRKSQLVYTVVQGLQTHPIELTD
jgi:hypothetical protein